MSSRGVMGGGAWFRPISTTRRALGGPASPWLEEPGPRRGPGSRRGSPRTAAAPPPAARGPALFGGAAPPPPRARGAAPGRSLPSVLVPSLLVPSVLVPSLLVPSLLVPSLLVPSVLDREGGRGASRGRPRRCPRQPGAQRGFSARAAGHGSRPATRGPPPGALGEVVGGSRVVARPLLQVSVLLGVEFLDAARPSIRPLDPRPSIWAAGRPVRAGGRG